MADDTTALTSSSSLDPTAPAFTMASTTPAAQSTEPTENAINGQQKPTETKQSKAKKSELKTTSTEQDTKEAGAGGKLTGAELKKQKAAEKAARRAEKVAEKGIQAQEVQQQAATPTRPEVSRRPSAGQKGSERPRRESVIGGNRQIPLRPNQANTKEPVVTQQDKKLDKRVPMLSHLYPSSTKRVSIASAGREIHPAVLTLGLQLRDYVICGSNARTVATLLVFKKVVQAYSTPAGVALSRHLTSHLSHQIGYLSYARPLSVAQGNSIRWLKKLISALDPDLAENDAKSFLCKAIDGFIREKVTLADEVIAREAGGRIEDEGEVILTYGKSSVVEKTLLTAWKSGKRFKVVVVDSRPLFEGKNLARSLLRAGLTDVRYCLLSGLSDAIETEGVTKCILGAGAMLGNGRLSSRSGTAMVAMMAKEAGNDGGHGKGKVPVLVLCESIKFTARVALDSLSMNEIGDADALIETSDLRTLTASATQPQLSKQTPDSTDNNKKGGSSSGNKPNANDGKSDGDDKKDHRGLEGWRDQQNLYLVNLMHDVTPAEYLDMVISELGCLPPGAVPVVNGVHGGDE